MFSFKKPSITDLQWQEVMFQAIRSLHSRGKLSATECGKLAGSVVAPPREKLMPPFTVFNNYGDYRRYQIS